MNNNKKSMFSGTGDIFAFTFRHAVGAKAFCISTILIALILTTVFMLMPIIPATIDANKASSDKFSINKVYALNYNTFPSTVWDMIKNVNTERFGDVVFEESDLTPNEIAASVASSSESNVGILIPEATTDNFKLTFVIPDSSEIKESDANELLELFSLVLEQSKAIVSGLSPELLVMLNSPIITDVSTAGEESRGVAEILINMITPLVVVLVVYMMTILYGQTISKSIISEKASKLMETLLTSVRPYAIIAGKIIAMWLVSVMQFTIWIVAGIGGFFIGDIIAKQINPNYTNYIIEVLNMLREHSSPDAFSVMSIVLSIVSLLAGLLFYFVLAGLISSKINRAEELQSGMVLFQLPIIISFIVTYLIPLTGSFSGIVAAFPYIPFTAAFTTPSYIIIGNISIVGGIISLVITLLCTALLIIFTGKIYRGNVLNQGKPLFKTVK